MELKGKKINFLGDSITEGVGASDVSKCYVSLLYEACALGEARNYGIGGTRIARQSELNDTPYDCDFNMRVDKMDEDADVVLVFGGTNDFGHGQARLGAISDREVFTFYGALHTLISALKERFKNAKIAFVAPIRRHNGESMQGAWKPEGVEQRPLSEYVRAIKEVCGLYEIPVLDLYTEPTSLRGDDSEWCREFMPDGLHPNDKGYALLAKEIKEFLEKI